MGRTSIANRLERLEARTRQRALPTGPYPDKPQPDAAWYAQFEALWMELWAATSYMQYAGLDREHDTRDESSAPDAT